MFSRPFNAEIYLHSMTTSNRISSEMSIFEGRVFENIFTTFPSLFTTQKLQEIGFSSLHFLTVKTLETVGGAGCNENHLFGIIRSFSIYLCDTGQKIQKPFAKTTAHGQF